MSGEVSRNLVQKINNVVQKNRNYGQKVRQTIFIELRKLMKLPAAATILAFAAGCSITPPAPAPTPSLSPVSPAPAETPVDEIVIPGTGIETCFHLSTELSCEVILGSYEQVEGYHLNQSQSLWRNGEAFVYDRVVITKNGEQIEGWILSPLVVDR